jgi:hypothetical protein
VKHPSTSSLSTVSHSDFDRCFEKWWHTKTAIAGKNPIAIPLVLSRRFTYHQLHHEFKQHTISKTNRQQQQNAAVTPEEECGNSDRHKRKQEAEVEPNHRRGDNGGGSESSSKPRSTPRILMMMMMMTNRLFLVAKQSIMMKSTPLSQNVCGQAMWMLSLKPCVAFVTCFLQVATTLRRIESLQFSVVLQSLLSKQ